MTYEVDQSNKIESGGEASSAYLSGRERPAKDSCATGHPLDTVCQM